MTSVVTAEKKSVVAPMVAEFHEEARTTRRVLERVPADKLTWKPHKKSMSIGQLALHVAAVPGRFVPNLKKTEHEVNPTNFQFAEPASREEILAAFDQSVKDAGAFLESLSEEDAQADWTLKANGRTLFTKSRLGIIRMIMLSHIYHHRGELAVYLRLLDVPVPSIYGPSADENPFA
jgi:uncharacterized damage-inducible protein DinB